MSQIETMVAKLQLLAAKPSLSAAENAEAQAVMQSLKAEGMSNDEISKVSNGRWSMSTVKGYTTGVSAPSPSPWQNGLSALTDLIAANLSLDDIKAALLVNWALLDNKLTLEDVMSFLKSVAAAGLNPSLLISEVKALGQSGLSLEAAVGVTAFKDKMKSYGLNVEELPALVKIAQQHGPLPKVLEAFSVYASLVAIQAEVTSAQKELEKIKSKAAAASQKLAQTETKRQELQAPIQAYQMALEYGFNEKALAALSDLAALYGGPKAVIEAVKKYIGLEDIKGQMAAAKSKLAEYESKTSQAITKHGHLTTAIKMCETLIADHQYGLDAISTILGVAQKFGEPVVVLKAVEVYGKLASLEKHASELAGIVAERQKSLAGLEGQFNEAQEKLDGLLAVVLELADKAGRLEGQFEASENLQKLLTIIQSPERAVYAEHGQIVMMLAVSLRKWVATNEASFKSPGNIKVGLEALAKELGGLP